MCVTIVGSKLKIEIIRELNFCTEQCYLYIYKIYIYYGYIRIYRRTPRESLVGIFQKNAMVRSLYNIFNRATNSASALRLISVFPTLNSTCMLVFPIHTQDWLFPSSPHPSTKKWVVVFYPSIVLLYNRLTFWVSSSKFG